MMNAEELQKIIDGMHYRLRWLVRYHNQTIEYHIPNSKMGTFTFPDGVAIEPLPPAEQRDKAPGGKAPQNAEDGS